MSPKIEKSYENPLDVIIHNYEFYECLISLSENENIKLGNELFNTKDYEKAKEFYSKEIQNKDALHNIALCYMFSEDYDNMVIYFEKAIENGDIVSMNHLGRFYWLRNDNMNMLKYYLMALKLNDTKSMISLANMSLERKDYKNMLKYYLMAIALGDKLAMKNLFRYYEYTKDYIHMIKYGIMAINAGDFSLAHDISNYYIITGDNENIKIYANIAIKNGQDLSLNNLSIYYSKIGKYEKSLNCILELSRKYPGNSAIIFNNLAWCYKNTKDYDNMIKTYLLAIQLGDFESMHNLAIYYRSIKDYTNMVKYLKMFSLKVDKDCKNDFSIFKNQKRHIRSIKMDSVKIYIF